MIWLRAVGMKKGSMLVRGTPLPKRRDRSDLPKTLWFLAHHY